jgi:phosphohistidine swiveling domain-containing protein
MGLIIALEEAKRHKELGNKTQMLRFMQEKGFRVPVTLVCTPKAYTRYLEDQIDLVEELKAELARTIDPGKQYAVRSSASLEDQSAFSFAGQFKSVLHTQGVDNILQAIWSIWGTARSANVQSYLERHGVDPAEFKMAIIIQQMVLPQVSGVAFSKNPVTGLDEVVVEAVAGSGEALMQEGATPLRWVNKWGLWVKKPAEEGEIPFELIEEVVAETKAIAKHHGRPVDLEWVYDGRSVTWVQLREITSLDVSLYSNRISAEFFPGLIKPLVWSVNVPLVNGAWVRLFTELIGPNDIDPHDLAKSFYYRAYFNMGAVGRIFELLGFPRESLELMMGIEEVGPDKPRFRPSARTYAYLPRMLLFALRKLGFGRRVERFVPAARERYRTFVVDDDLEVSQLIREIDRLYALNQETAYFNIVTPLLMQLYGALLRGQLARLGIPFESLDLTEGMEELHPYDPNVHLAELNRRFCELDSQTRERIEAGTYAQFRTLAGIDLLQQGVEQFIAQFGHLSDSGNDFSAVPWRENPDLVLMMIASFGRADASSSGRRNWTQLELTPLRRLLLRPLYQSARRYQFYRETISSLYTYGYGLFRVYFLALGSQLEARGWIESQEDVFYLYLDELREFEGNDVGDRLRARVAERKQEMERCTGLTPPNVIYGDEEIRLTSDSPHRLEGTPTSGGYYTGPAKVLKGISDFSKMEPGDVLVIPFSDVGWTPLFAKAGAVVAESGGILSHSSIVAREYGIPAVVSVPNACQLQDGTLVTVDGFQGVVSISEVEV